ncbi:Uu.00g064000.m01.CDS01 [Anthostomella pinea]|uniref:Uu.00g064000.m01.CDS01 n=1 Tax=Anthostomella pinea TaxID=933095 RepID=A0AAI8YN33_9PEZI|nr:Uu.00g064000.m01.CDS01 [Anthostomella pinea]
MSSANVPSPFSTEARRKAMQAAKAAKAAKPESKAVVTNGHGASASTAARKNSDGTTGTYGSDTVVGVASATSKKTPPHLRPGRLVSPITPTMWFTEAGLAKAAIDFYMSIFPHSRVVKVCADGSMTTFELDGQPFAVIDSSGATPNSDGRVGPRWGTGSFSFKIMCRNQREIDHYWDRLGAGIDEKFQMYGWTPDKFGVMWQIFCQELDELHFNVLDEDVHARLMVMMKEGRKPDIETIRKVIKGKGSEGN